MTMSMIAFGKVLQYAAPVEPALADRDVLLLQKQ